MAFSFSNVSVFTKEAKALFAEANSLATGTPLLDALLSKGAITVQPATLNTVTLIGMSALDGYREFKPGESHYTSASAFSKAVTIRNWDNGVEIGRYDFEDMGNNPAGRQMYLKQIADLVGLARRHKEDTLVNLIKASGEYDSADTEKNQTAYDTNAFFSSSRDSGANVTDTSSATWDHKTLKEQVDSLSTAWTTQKAYKSSVKQRSSMPRRGLVILCSPKRWRVMTEVFGAAILGSPATGTVTDGIASISNVLKEKFSVEIIDHNGFADTEWYAVDVSGMIPGVGPIVQAERQALELEMNTPQSDSYMDGFVLKAHAHMRYTWCWGNWNKMYKFYNLSSS